MYPAIPNGMAAKYKIPALNPLPASSPICAADLVQIEHCANDCNVVKDNKIIGCFTVEVINQMNHKVAFTTCMGGKGLFDTYTVKQYEDWCRSNGITKIRAYAQDSQARLFKIKLGLEKVTNVVEKTL